MKFLKLNFFVEQIIFQNVETGYCVLDVSLKNGRTIVAVGILFGVDVGQFIQATGFFVQHKFYGTQFFVENFKQKLPSNEIAIRKFLESGVLKGVGPVLCNRLVDEFKNQTLEVLQQNPEKLLKIKGFSEKLVNKIKIESNKLFSMKQLFMFLQNFNLKSIYGLKAWLKWGLFAIEKIKNNPYCLCDENINLTFFEADLIAKKFNIKFNSLFRVESAIKFVLKHNANRNGHTCAPLKNVVQIVAKFLNLSNCQIKKNLIEIVNNKKLFCSVFNGKEFLFLPVYYNAEQLIAKKILNLINFNKSIEIELLNKMLIDEQKKFNLILSKQQKNAIFKMLTTGVFILTGGPGTGKTTILKIAISMFKKLGLNVAVCAPTGKAAEHLLNFSGENKSTTIHRLLGFNSKKRFDDFDYFVHNQNNLLKHDVVLVDEMSMVDCLLFFSLIKALKSSCRLILTGDHNQLPSINAGCVFKNLIDCKKIQTVKLTKVFRQAAKSLIIKNSHKILKGQCPDLKCVNGNFFFIENKNNQKIASLIVDLATNRVVKHFNYNFINDLQIICFLKKGIVGSINLNKMLQSVVNAKNKNKAEFSFGAYTYREGDRIMQIKNDYNIQWTDGVVKGHGIFNGDIGYLIKIDTLKQIFEVNFNGKIASFSFSQANQIELAYASTVHKSQGNEFKCVLIPLAIQHSDFFSKNLLYTAITRAKENCVVVGRKTDFEFMCKQNKINCRYSGLKWFILNSNLN